MKIAEHQSVLTHTCNTIESRWTALPIRPSFLHLVTGYELEDLSKAISRASLPADLTAKLKALAGDDLTCRFIEQNCRLFIALLGAAQEGTFRRAGPAERERLLRVLAYVRKDDDYTPDYRRDGFDDDRQEVRAAMNELNPLLQDFKAWRLRHQVAGMWPAAGSDIALRCPRP